MLPSIEPHLNQKAIHKSQLTHDLSPSGAKLPKKDFSDGEQIDCRLEMTYNSVLANNKWEIVATNILFSKHPIQIGDLIIYNNIQYNVLNVDSLYDYPEKDLIHHYESILK